jgi:integrase/recombinase XerD
VKHLENAIDRREREAIELWRKGHLSPGTIVIYLQWVRRFRIYCEKRKLLELEQLTADGVRRFTRAYAGPRLRGRASAQNSCNLASNALHAWSCVLHALGVATLTWQAEREVPPLAPLLVEYRQFRKAHCGVSDWTLRRDTDTAGTFLGLLRSRRKPVERISLNDVDVFVRNTAVKVSTSTVADTCSSLRSFLRFLHATGRLTSDLASGVMRPRFRVSQRPPRTLPWGNVQRILRSIEKKRPPGKRDFAILLLLATYGLGAAEVLALRLEDIELPLLPAVARALTDYLRRERPPAKGSAHVFLRKNMPYEPMTSGAIRHRIRYWAKLAGIQTKVLGAHAFRHSHATRQVDAGANIKIVSDILGHRSVSSTSVYVRVALERLRGVALAVPR